MIWILCSSDHFPIQNNCFCRATEQLCRWGEYNIEVVQGRLGGLPRVLLGEPHIPSQFEREWVSPYGPFYTKVNKLAEKSIAKTLTVPKMSINPGLRIIVKRQWITLRLGALLVRPSVNPRDRDVSKLDPNTSVKQTWRMIQKISGKRKVPFPDSDTITNKREIADTLATSFLLLSHH